MTTASPPEAGHDPTSEMEALHLLIELGRARRRVASWTFGAGLLALVVAFLIPKTYTGVTRILPPQQGQSSAAALLGQLAGGLGGLASSAVGIKNPSDLYVSMMRSATVEDALVGRFKLKEVYREEYLSDARDTLRTKTRIIADKAGVIRVEVDARDPGMAADLANAYIDELYKLTTTLAFTEASQRRMFFERQLQLTKTKLAESEGRLRQAMETGGLVSVDAQSRATVETIARLRALITAKEVQIDAMRAFATAFNPDLQRVQEELGALQNQLLRLESGAGAAAATAAGAGGQGLGNLAVLREVKYNEVLFELLAKQYEVARVDEAKEAPLIQVLDRAVPPERKSGPKRALIALVGALLGLLAAVGGVLGKYRMAQLRADPLRKARVDALRDAWMIRRPGSS